MLGMLAQINRLRWRPGKSLSSGGPEGGAVADMQPHTALSCAAGCSGKALEVELRPMEIRTFLLVPVFGALPGAAEGSGIAPT